MHSAVLVAGAFIVVIGLAGCAAAEPDPGRDRSAFVALPAADIGAGCSGTVYDYEPTATPDQLAADSDLVVRGRVSGVRDQPGGGASSMRSNIVRIDVTHVVVGEGVGAAVDMTLVAPVGREVDECAAGLPVGTAVVLYGTAVPGPYAKSPDGVPMYIPGPLGFVVEAEEGQLVWPLIGVSEAGVLADVLPGS